MYSIVLTDGKIVNVHATDVKWYEKSRYPRRKKENLNANKLS